MWSLSNCTWTWTNNHLVHKGTPNQLAQLTKWLSCVVSTYLYGGFDSVFLSCHVRASGWIYTLSFLECQETSCTKHARNLDCKGMQLNWNPQQITSYDHDKQSLWYRWTAKRVALFPRRTIVRDPHHRGSPTSPTSINKYSTIEPNWPNDWAVLWVFICAGHLTVCSCHATYAFQSDSTLYSCLNVKERLAWNRRDIWNLSEWNWTRTNNHLVHKWKLKHLAQLVKLSSCLVSSYLYSGFDSVFLSCHVRVSECIPTL